VAVPAIVLADSRVALAVVEHPLHLLALAEQVYNLRKIQIIIVILQILVLINLVIQVDPQQEHTFHKAVEVEQALQVTVDQAVLAALELFGLLMEPAMLVVVEVEVALVAALVAALVDQCHLAAVQPETAELIPVEVAAVAQMRLPVEAVDLE